MACFLPIQIIMKKTFYTVENNSTPIIAFAIHDGHWIDNHLQPYLLLDEQQRSREEDPYTGYMIADLPVSRITVHRSRFQLDLNRMKEKSVYKNPEDAWGLDVWSQVPADVIADLYKDYEGFYNTVYALVEEAIVQHGYFFILDIHSYNHRREGYLSAADDATHPEINIGTYYNREAWQQLCVHLTTFMASCKIFPHAIDARQNVIFKGGALSQQILEKYGDKGAVFSVEFKKTFMDEWTGIADIPHIHSLKELLKMAVSYLYKARGQ